MMPAVVEDLGAKDFGKGDSVPVELAEEEPAEEGEPAEEAKPVKEEPVLEEPALERFEAETPLREGFAAEE